MMKTISEYQNKLRNQPAFGMKGKLDKETLARRRAWEQELSSQKSDMLLEQAASKPKDDIFEYRGQRLALNETIPPVKKGASIQHTQTPLKPVANSPEMESSQLALAALLTKKETQKADKKLEQQRKQAQADHEKLQRQSKSSLDLLARLGLLGNYLNDPGDKILLRNATRYKSLPSDVEMAKSQAPDLFTPEIQERLTRFRVTRAENVPLAD